MSLIHAGDVGTVLEITVTDENDVVLDIASQTALNIFLKKPDGTVLTKVAVLTSGGTDGKMQYTTIAGDVTTADGGAWEIQGKIVIPQGTFYTRVADFQVKGVLG